MKNAQGLSFIEVLFAATIFAIAFLALAALFPTAYRNVDWSGEQTTAVTLAQQQLEGLRNQPYAALVAPGPPPENLTGNYAGYTRTTTIQDDIPMVDVKQLTVTVTSPSGKNATLVTLITE